MLLKCINNTMLDKDISDCYAMFKGICEHDFKSHWSFDKMEKWLKETDIKSEKKDFIYKMIEMFKPHNVN